MSELPVLPTGSEQFRLLVLCFFFGVALNLLHLPLAVWQIAKRRHPLAQGIADVLFCTVVGLLLFFFALAINKGILRMGMLLCTAVGYWLGSKTFEHLCLKIFLAVRRPILAFFRRCAVFLQTTGQSLWNLAKKIAVFLKKGLRSLCSLVYNRK